MKLCYVYSHLTYLVQFKFPLISCLSSCIVEMLLLHYLLSWHLNSHQEEPSSTCPCCSSWKIIWWFSTAFLIHCKFSSLPFMSSFACLFLLKIIFLIKPYQPAPFFLGGQIEAVCFCLVPVVLNWITPF